MAPPLAVRRLFHHVVYAFSAAAGPGAAVTAKPMGKLATPASRARRDVCSAARTDVCWLPAALQDTCRRLLLLQLLWRLLQVAGQPPAPPAAALAWPRSIACAGLTSARDGAGCEREGDSAVAAWLSSGHHNEHFDSLSHTLILPPLPHTSAPPHPSRHSCRCALCCVCTPAAAPHRTRGNTPQQHTPSHNSNCCLEQDSSAAAIATAQPPPLCSSHSPLQ